MDSSLEFLTIFQIFEKFEKYLKNDPLKGYFWGSSPSHDQNDLKKVIFIKSEKK